MAAEEDALEHQHPGPCECHHYTQGSESKRDQARTPGQDFGGEFQNLDAPTKSMPVGNHTPAPEDGEQERDETEPSHDLILHTVAMIAAPERGNQRV